MVRLVADKPVTIPAVGEVPGRSAAGRFGTASAVAEPSGGGREGAYSISDRP